MLPGVRVIKSGGKLLNNYHNSIINGRWRGFRGGKLIGRCIEKIENTWYYLPFYEHQDV